MSSNSSDWSGCRYVSVSKLLSIDANGWLQSQFFDWICNSVTGVAKCDCGHERLMTTASSLSVTNYQISDAHTAHSAFPHRQSRLSHNHLPSLTTANIMYMTYTCRIFCVSVYMFDESTKTMHLDQESERNVSVPVSLLSTTNSRPEEVLRRGHPWLN